MRSICFIAALSGLWNRVAAVLVVSQKWNLAAQPTALPVGTQPSQWAPGPAPTASPDSGLVEMELARREVLGDTCGYVSGDADSSFGCDVGSRCINNGGLSAVFCCDSDIAATDSECVAIATCLHSADWETITTDIPLETVYCSKKGYPYCVPYVFGNAPISGFTWFACEETYTRRVVSSDPTNEPTTVPTTTSTPSPTTSPSQTAATSSSSSTTASDGSPTPIGAIVGGVLGGIAILALTVLGIFFLVRKKRVPEATTTTTTAPAPAPTSPPPMHQQQTDFQPMHQHTPPPPQQQQAWSASPGPGVASLPPGYAGTGNYSRVSLVKSPLVERDSVLSSPSSAGLSGSPSPGFHGGAFSPAPQQYGAALAPLPQGQGQVQVHHELPTVAGEGEVRELQG